MTKTIEAIYTDGVFKPTQPVEGLRENDCVILTVDAKEVPNPLVGWVGGLPDEDAAEMIRAIEEEFEKVGPNHHGDAEG